MLELIRYGPHPEQFGELTLPEPGNHHKPLIMLIHGGFWRDKYRHDRMHPLVADLSQRGYASWNIEYRRVGPTGGGYPDTLDDIAAAIDHFSSSAWATTAVIGHSAGGQLALWNASRPDAARRADLTVGLAAVCDVIDANRRSIGAHATSDFFGGTFDEVPDRYLSGQPNPPAFAGRVVLIHGDADKSVPVDQSAALADHVARCEILRDTDHFDVIDPQHHSWSIVIEELAALSPDR